VSGPDAAMMAPVRAVARFMATLDDAHLASAFTADPLIVENFAPYVFRGADALARWRDGFRDHAATLGDLTATFGAPQDFSLSGANAYFVLPTRWTGLTRGKPFEEDGGWAFVLAYEGDAWRIACYAWAVTAFRTV